MSSSAEMSGDLSPGLTWKILSHLARGTSSELPPFYCQRNEGAKEPNSELFFIASPIYDCRAIHSLDHIQKEFMHVLETYSDGKMSVTDIGVYLGMNEYQVKNVGESLCTQQVVIEVQGGYALKSLLIKQLVQSLNMHCMCTEQSSDLQHTTLESMVNNPNTQCSQSAGGVTVQQLSTELGLEKVDVTHLLDELFDGRSECQLDSNIVVVKDELTGELLEVTNSSLLTFRKTFLEMQVLNALVASTVPVSLESLFPDHNLSTITSIAQKLCNAVELDGVLNHSTFTPAIYSNLQKKNVDAFFRANGYLTEKKCIGFGVAKHRMEQFVKESFPNAILLNSSIIDTKQTCLPLEDAIQSSVLNASFVDFRSILPDDFTICEEDLLMLVKDILVNQLKLRDDNVYEEYCKGVTVMTSTVALFFSETMTQQARKLIPPLIEEYARCKAFEKTQQVETMDQKIISLNDVAKAISDAFPELSDVQQHYEITHNKKSFFESGELLWSHNDSATTDGPLVEFCRNFLDLTELHIACQRAIKAETIAIQHKANVKFTRDGAASIQNKEEAFESSFRDMCYMLQLFAKGIQTMEGKTNLTSEVEILERMKSNLLLSCGSCLAKRITEYCLFKHAVTEEQTKTLLYNCAETGQPQRDHNFCIPVDLGCLAFPSFTLSCMADPNGKSREPLVHLKSLFPPGVGIHLMQIWSLCSANGSTANNKGNLDAFIDHLKEMCLPLVGIPFSTLDKKTEKRLLAARRQCISDLLQYTRDKEEVLLSAIVFTFQLSKNASLVGRTTIKLALDAVFNGDKKISQSLIDLLNKLEESAHDDNLIDAVKRIGTAKNIKSCSELILQ